MFSKKQWGDIGTSSLDPREEREAVFWMVSSDEAEEAVISGILSGEDEGSTLVCSGCHDNPIDWAA